jgi:crotonobetainyl-CoA:carnitine CoA-transferase CaiB-like acyl-CoA transferase
MLPTSCPSCARHLPRTAVEWEEIFGERGAADREMFDHPQVIAEDQVTTLDHAVVGHYRTMTKPIEFADTPGPPPRPSPLFGQHSDEILADYGYTAEDIAALRGRGIIR